ncbi:hypothetical protein [Henriciella litoralis]|nr:hypothetical protein [Henriciella litoralis]
MPFGHSQPLSILFFLSRALLALGLAAALWTAAAVWGAARLLDDPVGC